MSETKSRATEDLLDLLHGTVAQSLLDEIKRYKDLKDENNLPLPLPASLVAQAVKFLKDNGIDRPRSEGSSTDLLADELDDLDRSNVVAFKSA